MLEDEIRNLTVAIKTLTSTTEALVTATMQLRSSLHLTAGNAEDDAYRAGLQAARKKAAELDSAAEKTLKPSKKIPAPEKIAEKIAEPAAEPVAPPPADPAPSISKENLKAMALSISRADMNAKPLIFEILGKYGAKTITALPDDPDALYEVFTGFTKIANKIAKDGE